MQERGVLNAPEDVVVRKASGSRDIPDILVNFQGLRTAIECEVDDQPNARERAIESARDRVVTGIAHIGIAVVYPGSLRRSGFDRLKTDLASSQLQIAVVTESKETSYTPGDVNYLEIALRQTFNEMIQEDVVARATAALDAGVERFASAVRAKAGFIGRMANVLGIKELPQSKRIPKGDYDMWGGLSVKEREAVSHIAGLVLINAMVFQEALSMSDVRVEPLQRTLSGPIAVNAFFQHWAFIVAEINYYPIFHLGGELLNELTADADLAKALAVMAEHAQSVVVNRAALRHDLMGRVYHRLLADAKYLATYYTRIPSATLLLKLALGNSDQCARWHDLKEVSKLRIADLACGTGTLLTAAADAVMDNYIAACAEKGVKVNVGALHKAVVEGVLYGFDVLPSALHLTASTLAMRAPDVLLHEMKLFSLPLGGRDMRLGSIEFLAGDSTKTQRGLFDQHDAIEQMDGKGKRKRQTVDLPMLDLCVMNPPFTRSAGENLLFGSAPAAERKDMQKRLKKLVDGPDVFANITAGLGSVFVAAADPHIKSGGRLALVLPKTLLSGPAWDKTRQLIRRSYELEYIVVSSDPERWNFSESTDLSEVLLVARKNGADNGNHTDARVVAVNLWRNPSTSFEALAMARSAMQAQPPDVETGQGAQAIGVGSEKMGEAVSMSWQHLRDSQSWMLPCAFAQSDLIRAAFHLVKGGVWIPGRPSMHSLPVCRLDQLGTLGPDRRDIHDGFGLSKSVTSYPAFWAHKAEAVCTLSQQPNQHLSPLPTAAKNRKLRKAVDLWPRAGQVLLAERLRLNTQRLVAVYVDKPVLSNVWWPMALRDTPDRDTRAKALTIWLNSTPGLLMLLAHRQETQGAWVDFKKPTLSSMPVLDSGSLTEDQLGALEAVYDRICLDPMLPLPQMASDPTRAEIDSALAGALHIPDLAPLRDMLAREPVVCLRRL